MELLTIRETAQLLKVNPVTVRRFIESGRLPAVKVGKGLRVRKEAIERLASPVEPKREQHPSVLRGKPTSADDPLWTLIGLGASEEPTTIAQHKHQYLADAYTAKTT